MLSLSFVTAAITPAMRDLVALKHKPITAMEVNAHTDPAARALTNAMFFGIPLTRPNDTTITVFTSDPSKIKTPTTSAGNNSTILRKPTTTAAAAASEAHAHVHTDADPIPEYDDPGYRVRCGDTAHEDYKEAFECWFYHRTRCFGGVLTSLDPICIHDCGCEHNTYDLYDQDTKGNHGAGRAGVCIVLPVPEYSPQDGGCV